MNKPLVSVLMTAYNRENYITSAIESVLSSTLKDFELIITDDCSKDKTIEIAQAYAAKDSRVKVYTNETNLGDYPNRNKAASYASGKYIKYLDSDDIMYPHCLEVMVHCMESFPEAGFGLSAKADLYKPYPVVLTSKEVYLEHFNGYGHFDRAPGSSIIKKEAFDSVGGFSGERMIGDTDLWYRLAMNFSMVKFPVELYWSRIHAGQESQSTYAQKQYDLLRKKVLERHFNNTACPLNDIEKNTFRTAIEQRKKKEFWLRLVRKLIP